MADKLKIAASWSDDCQGKKDYDGPILSVSTRYWPAGGHALIVNRTAEGVTMEQEANGRPAHASSAINLDLADGDYLVLAMKHFEAPTFEEVAPQVEAWAQEQMDRVVRALTAEFGEPVEHDVAWDRAAAAPGTAAPDGEAHDGT